MKNKKLLKVITSAVFASLITGLTFFPKVPIPGGGYIHLGDTVIYLAASFLPLPYAMTAAAIGGGLADLLAGYAAYAPFTLVAKALLTIAFTHKSKKILSKRNYIAPLAGIFVTSAVYFIADWVLYGIAGAVSGTIWNITQAVASMILYYIIATAFDKMQLKDKFTGKIQ